jgi:hypothetical protein
MVTAPIWLSTSAEPALVNGEWSPVSPGSM